MSILVYFLIILLSIMSAAVEIIKIEALGKHG